MTAAAFLIILGVGVFIGFVSALYCVLEGDNRKYEREKIERAEWLEKQRNKPGYKPPPDPPDAPPPARW